MVPAKLPRPMARVVKLGSSELKQATGNEYWKTEQS